MIKSCSVFTLRGIPKLGKYRVGALRISKRRRSISVYAHRIAVLPGDGIGPEITNVALKLLKRAAIQTGEEFTFEEAPFGGAAIDATGEAYPESTQLLCKKSDAVLLAAIGGDKWDHLPAKERPERGLLDLRASLGAFANLRPALVFNQVERIAHVAFKLAMKRNKRLCSVDKSNVLEVSQLWREVVERVAQHYPEVQLEHMYVDNACMQLISQPKYFDTILTGTSYSKVKIEHNLGNIFGDILSDGAAALTGSLGLLPSASISTSGPGIFEPVHGSAPTIAGLDVANPIAMVLSASMMCKYGLNLPQISSMLDSAVFGVLEKGYRTRDIISEGKEEVKCSQMGNLLLEEMAILTKA
eukprot:g3993.t1